jgi:caa(3)-type oxidase subunit IV
MSEQTTVANPYRIYWITWAALLVITVMMLGAEMFHMPRWFLIVFLVGFMMVKATMIVGNFMHLRFESRQLAVTVVVSLLLTSLILFSFITPESLSVLARTAR